MIRLEHVCKSWDQGVTLAVNDVSFEVAAGEMLALLGASGSGKSTTIKMINRLVEPTSGKLSIDGQDIRDCDPVQLRRQIGYVFQAVGLFPHLTVAQNVAIVPRLEGRAEDATADRIGQLLERVHLPPAEFADRFPRELSGGERQRVGFARSLAANANLMLLDEPFGALDPVTRSALQTEFQLLQQSLGLTAVLVTHDMAEALLLADRIGVMKQGSLIRLGTPRELLQDPGDDYVAALLETPRRQSERIYRLAHPADGRPPQGTS